MCGFHKTRAIANRVSAIMNGDSRLRMAELALELRRHLAASRRDFERSGNQPATFEEHAAGDDADTAEIVRDVAHLKHSLRESRSIENKWIRSVPRWLDGAAAIHAGLAHPDTAPSGCETMDLPRKDSDAPLGDLSHCRDMLPSWAYEDPERIGEVLREEARAAREIAREIRETLHGWRKKPPRKPHDAGSRP